MDFVFIAMAVAFLVATLVFPLVLRFAQYYQIVDNPNARKLQRQSVPLLGGIVVYCGILAGIICYYSNLDASMFPLGIVGMTIMLIIGTWDDVRNLSVIIRFIVEILVIVGLIFYVGFYLDDMHGLWGFHTIDPIIAYPLSIISGVGIINAMNLIDGIDGYSSGYGIFACVSFAILFGLCDKPATMMIALVTAASLLPFFLHNVFGKKTKMFIGDGGTLMLGVLMTMFVFSSLSSKSTCFQLDRKGFSLIAYCLAILSIPVFDTLRVMISRMVRGRSPFQPDKTHLHHLFIDMGFSHLGAAAFIISLNALIALAWYACYKLGGSLDLQVYVVIVLGILLTFVLNKFMRAQQFSGPIGEDGTPVGTAVWRFACRVGKMSHIEKGAFWQFMRQLVDNELFKKG